ncbi:MAG: hypothetical protein LBS91_06965 [Clostridiales Family XIII bacterium]|jgi:uroporphyrinogen-III decarboxylase|nr:hypothetical protein [Clostridiales Family XIII bacterium]
MGNISDIQIPAMPESFPKIRRDYPISERENFLRMLRHEKPLWMPNFEESLQMGPAGPNEDQPTPPRHDHTDWFGVYRKYSEAQDSCTPVGAVIDTVDDWKGKVIFPDLKGLDWTAGAADFARDENRALVTRMNGGIFQRLHALLGFENALVDMITKPAETREFLEALADFEIEVFLRMNEVHHYDVVIYHDDWGTARAPFFSTDLFKETLLPPTRRFFKAVREAGAIPFSHNCGLVEDLIPFLVDDIGVDGVEIQSINDIGGIVKNYGDRLTVEFTRPDDYFFYDPKTTEKQIREKAREYVDRYGAHANPGAGAIVTIYAPSREVYDAFYGEVYQYSREQYRGL